MSRLRATLHDSELVEVAKLRSGTGDVALLEGQRVVRTFPDLDTAVRKTIVSPSSRKLRKKAPAFEHIRAYMQAQVAEIERTDPIVRVDQNDHEALHDLRVAVRRLRAVLRATRELFDGAWVTSLRSELKWFGRELAANRHAVPVRLRVQQEYDHLVAASHVEIERMNGTLQQIYASRTWKLHLFLDRLRGRR